MTTTEVSRTGRTALAGLAVLLCAGLAACGTVRAGEAAGPAAPVAAPGPERCDLYGTTGTDAGAGGATAAPDVPTEERTGGYADPPTDEETGGYAGPPTDEETGGYAGPPTDEETGAYAGPPTDEETGGYAGPPTDQETGGPAGPPTDQDSGAPDPPTDGSSGPGRATNGAGPCGAAGWFDMKRDFVAYYARHRTDEDTFIPADGMGEVLVRKERGRGVAEVTFTTRSVGKGRGDDARRVVRVFAAWRHEVYGGTDAGNVTVRTRGEFPVTVTDTW
ncbi:hypothetical protein OHA37_02345 [Streptomyces sp. NBC_00335]|uniref:hypothetical protein n=1 Tax=unclassified Streptomyces TaxID=2593676 RepID=UPI00224FFDAA|nr:MULTISPECIES: hypothetical protein [unclassified Streptomyces]MCX5402723.1 hypothetical protein [Streptomyces sp. NBC_00086]